MIYHFLTSSSQLFMLSKVTCLSFKRHSNSEVTDTEEGRIFDSFLVEIKPRLSANATSSSQERIKRLEHDNCLPYKETIFITFILFK